MTIDQARVAAEKREQWGAQVEADAEERRRLEVAGVVVDAAVRRVAAETRWASERAQVLQRAFETVDEDTLHGFTVQFSNRLTHARARARLQP